MRKILELGYAGYRGFMYSQGHSPDLMTLALVNGTIETSFTALEGILNSIADIKSTVPTKPSIKPSLITYHSMLAIQSLPSNLNKAMITTVIGFPLGYLVGTLSSRFL